MKKKKARTSFLLGFMIGIFTMVAILLGTMYGGYAYLKAMSKTPFVNQNIIQSAPSQQNKPFATLSLPITGLLQQASTTTMQMSVQGDQLNIVNRTLQIPFLPFGVTITLTGHLFVLHGYLVINHVQGKVDALPIPTFLLFDAITRQGSTYGIVADAKNDRLWIVRTFSPFSLLRYQASTQSIDIGIPQSYITSMMHKNGFASVTKP